MAEEIRPGAVRPGGRTARTKRAVLAATLTELVENGYAGTSLEKIAARAGVAVSTLYRRWGGLDRVILEAGMDVGTGIVTPDTGDFERDLIDFARAVVEVYRNPVAEHWLYAMVVAATRDPSARATFSLLFENRFAEVVVIVRRALERGEVHPDTDPAEVIRSAAAPIYYRMLVTGEPVDDAVAERAARTAALAARAGVLRAD
ncbi:TetR/AcrR family transcriptional regulator [Nocardia sp. NPDC047038]|uniref:TetR/AcrR family transcriptional regulator n=1 Tax=Nocardia sp. NPDC047038 TaxID=3154338 RepID=UPI0033DEF3A2